VSLTKPLDGRLSLLDLLLFEAEKSKAAAPQTHTFDAGALEGERPLDRAGPSLIYVEVALETWSLRVSHSFSSDHVPVSGANV
jgi:hypothetical protein